MTFVELLYHSVVRDIRKTSGNYSLGLGVAILQSMSMLLIFFVIYTAMGMRSVAIRGDFVVFLLTGIFLFLTHNKAIKATMGAGNANSSMMQHAPMNTLLMFAASAISGLYLQVVAISVILFFVHVLRGHLEFYDPAGLLMPFFLAWASGIAIGLIFNVLQPLAPKAMQTISMLYRRANIITSGKMLPANYMTLEMVNWFDWNPLFHCIDQARGAAFVNYFPRNSNLEYPIYFTLTVILIGLMGEHWLRRNMSSSWGKRSI